MFINTRMATRLKKPSFSILITFMLLLILAPASIAQEKVKPTGTDTQAQQITFEQHIAELEAKLKSVKEQIGGRKRIRNCMPGVSSSSFKCCLIKLRQ